MLLKQSGGNDSNCRTKIARRLVTTFVVFASIAILPRSSFSQSLRFVDEKSVIQFHIRNFGVGVTGVVKGLKGRAEIDRSSNVVSYFEASLQASTVDTGIAIRDRHLRQKDYFNAESFPEITVRSKTITMNGNSGIAVADVTMKGITHEIFFSFTASGTNTSLVFTGHFTLNRRDFNVGGRSISLSDDVDVEFLVTGER